jgi:feruloyl esterase
LVFIALSAYALAAPVKNCADLPKTQFGADVKIDSASWFPQPRICRSTAKCAAFIWPEAKFAVKLPTAWNNRFQMVGNGGWAGTISTGPMDSALRAGYATTSTDTGHDSQKEPVRSSPSPARPIPTPRAK